MKRNKRLKKGIESLEKQFAIHERKFELAKKNEDEYLVDYYAKELEGIREEKARKKKLLEKQ